MKKSWYNDMLKVAKAIDVTLSEAITIRRELSGLRMQQRADKPNKVIKGTPEPFSASFVVIPIISKRTGKTLYYSMELKEVL